MTHWYCRCLLVTTINNQTSTNTKAEQADKVGRNEKDRRDFVVPEKHLGQRLSEHSWPQNIFNDYNSTILWIDQKPLEVKMVDKINKSGVQFGGGAYGV